jgi:hypothetical protein
MLSLQSREIAQGFRSFPAQAALHQGIFFRRGSEAEELGEYAGPEIRNVHFHNSRGT